MTRRGSRSTRMSRTTTYTATDPRTQQQLERGRARLLSAPQRRERRAEALAGGLFLVAALALVVLADPPVPSAGAVLVLVAAYVAAMRIEFEVGPGYTVPTRARPDPDAVPAPRAARAVLRGRGRARGLPGQRRPGTAPPRSPAGRARSGLDRSRPGARVHPRVPRRRLVGRRPRRARRVRRLRGLRRRRVAVRWTTSAASEPLRPLLRSSRVGLRRRPAPACPSA